MALPQTPISGMYNKNGGKTRLTFKLDQDELWIGTKGTNTVYFRHNASRNYYFTYTSIGSPFYGTENAQRMAQLF